MCIWWGSVCVFFIGSRAGWAKISNFVFSLQNLLCPSRAQYVFKHIHTCSYIFIYNPMIEFPLASPIIDISFILIIEWLFWQIAASLTIECVLLLQNVFSCYRMCSLTIQYVLFTTAQLHADGAHCPQGPSQGRAVCLAPGLFYPIIGLFCPCSRPLLLL